MGAVEAYGNLDVSSSSPTFQALVESVDQEAKARSIGLTGAKQAFDARQPSRLTQAMSAWYMAHVAGLRVAAISEVNNEFRGEAEADSRAKSIYLEVERDKIRTTGIRAAIVETERFLHKHKELIEHHDEARQEFSTLKARLGGREPVRTKVWLYLLILFGLVLLEAFINFESFMRVPYITSPFLATGATVAVALGIAVAAHFHGVVLRQAHFLFSPQEAAEQGHKPRQNDAIRRVVIGFVLLTLALLMVAGSRYYYIRDSILLAQILGTAAPSMTGGIVFMLFGNIVAYIVALSVAYVFHDPNPLYAEKDVELRRATKQLEAVKKTRLLAQETLRHGTENELAARSKQDSTARGPRYAELRQQADIVDKKDQQVLGALLAYRTRLVQALHDRSDVKIFRYSDSAYDDLLPLGTDQMLTPEEYGNRPLTLGFMIGES